MLPPLHLCPIGVESDATPKSGDSKATRAESGGATLVLNDDAMSHVWKQFDDNMHPCDRSRLFKLVSTDFPSGGLAPEVRESLGKMGLEKLFDRRIADRPGTKLADVVRIVCEQLAALHAAMRKMDIVLDYQELWEALGVIADETEYFKTYLILNWPEAMQRYMDLQLHFQGCGQDVVLRTVSKFGDALEYASEELRANREVVLAAVKQDGYALEHASKELRDDLDVVLEAVKQDGFALLHASVELCADRRVVLVAVKQNGNMLEYASKEVRADRDVVLAAVKQNGWALRDAPRWAW